MSRTRLLAGLIVGLVGCEPIEPVPCRAQEFAEAVFLEAGDALLGPQCEDEASLRIEVLLTTDEGVMFTCTCGE